MSEPQYADLDELWTALEPHIDWPRGLALTLLFADHPHAVDELRDRAEKLVHSGGQTLFTLIPRTVDELASIVRHFLVRPADQVRALWIELWRGSGGEGWDYQVGDILQRLNERRAVLERVLRRPLVLVLPASLRTRIHVLAPDLWTIRSFTADLPSPVGTTRAPVVASTPVRSIFALPPPSLEEQEWTRLLATGQHDRIDAWDGIRALDAALERGSLASARAIALQVIALLVHGEVAEDACAMATHDVLRMLQDAGQPASQLLLAAVHRLGDVEVRAGNLSAARCLFQRSLDISEAFASEHPHSPLAQRDLSVSLIKLGSVEFEAGNLSAARSLFQRSLDIRETLASGPHSDPAQRNLSISLNKLGKVEVEIGNLSAARSLFQRSLEIRETLAAQDPHSARALRDLSISLDNLGKVEVEAGNLSAARSLFQRSLEIRETLAAQDPHSALALRDLSVSLDNLGKIEVETRNLSVARALFQRSLEISEALASQNPHSALAQRECIHDHVRFIELGNQLGDIAMQREHLDAAQSRLDRLAVRNLVEGYPEAEALRADLDRARKRLDAASQD